MEEIFSRTGSTLTVGGTTATIPEDITALSILSNNSFVPKGEYRDDGYIYVDNKPVKKWFKSIEQIRVWFPVLEDIKNLQRRYKSVKEKYTKYWLTVNKPAYEAVVKVKKAHAKITHKYSGSYDPWWLYESKKWGYSGISFDWVKEPENPVNLEIGNEYYRSTQRLEQLGGRVSMFRNVLMSALNSKVYKIKGECGELLQVKVLDTVYWYQHGRYVWEPITRDDSFKTIEL
jgi:hypothetical protein